MGRFLLWFVAGVICGGALVWMVFPAQQILTTPMLAPQVAQCPTPAAAVEVEPVCPPAPAVVAVEVVPATEAAPAPPAAPVERDAAAPPPLASERPRTRLLIPVAGVKASELSDTFTDSRAHHAHEAIDIMAPRGTPVLAVAVGKVVKLFKSVPGGLTVYQFDPTEKFAYYYAHLDRYAPGLAEGKVLKRGDPVGFVGYTGNASPKAPHLHFALFELGSEKRWWEGRAINPYPLFEGVDAPAPPRVGALTPPSSAPAPHGPR